MNQLQLTPDDPPARPHSFLVRLAPEWIYTGMQMQHHVEVLVDQEGRIVRLGPSSAMPTDCPVLNLPHKALFPGFANTHSHAFQRLIRGRTSTIPAGNLKSDFWSWRQSMYHAALALDPDAFECVTQFAYLEMLKAGITTVVEFHYLQHDIDGNPYSDVNLLAKRVIHVASQLGLRLTIVPVAYHLSDIHKAPLPEQRRFVAPSLDHYLEQVENLRSTLPTSARVKLGVGAHSVRAVPESWFPAIAQYAKTHGLKSHIHVAEQLAEVHQCDCKTGRRPVHLLDYHGFLTENTVLVHATHLDGSEKSVLKRTKSQISICPTTERDLGDGMVDARGFLDRGLSLSLGSDSNTIIDFFEEMRCLEGHERLRRQHRNVLIEPESRQNGRSIVPVLWDIATARGSDVAQFGGGSLQAGDFADGFTVDLTSWQLDGVRPELLPALLVAAGSSSLVRDVWVGGRCVIQDGQHSEENRIRESYRRINSILFS